MKPRKKRSAISKLSKSLNKHLDLEVIVGLLIASAALSGFYFGHTYGLNMTEDQKLEAEILPLCTNLNQIWIPQINQTCWESYGDIKRGPY